MEKRKGSEHARSSGGQNCEGAFVTDQWGTESQSKSSKQAGADGTDHAERQID